MDCQFNMKKIKPISMAISASLVALSIFNAGASEDDELLSFVSHSVSVPTSAVAVKTTTPVSPVSLPVVKPASLLAPASTQASGAATVMSYTPEVEVKASTASPKNANQSSAPLAGVKLPRVAAAPAAVWSPVTTAPQTQTAQARSHQPHDEGKATAERQIKQVFYNAVMLANRMSPTLNRSRAEFQAAQENVSEAKGQRWPQVDISSSSKNINFGGGSRSHQSDIPSVTVNMVTTVYDFGRLKNTIESRESSAKAANSGVAAESENTAWEVSSQLIQLSKERQIISLSEQYVARMNQLTTMMSGIVAADPGRRSELTQARGQLLKAKTSLDAAVSRAREIEINLYKYIGDAEITLPRTTQWQINPPDMNMQLAAISYNPLIAKARAETEATLKDAAALKASGLPALNWVVSKNTGEDEIGRREPFKTGLQVSWGIFRGGSTNASERAALMRAEASRQQIEETTRDLEHKIRTADQDAVSLRERAILYQNLSRETDRIRLDFFDQWYHLGKRTLLDVLSAESDFYGNRVGEVTSRFDSYSAVFSGYASAGILTKWLSQ